MAVKRATRPKKKPEPPGPITPKEMRFVEEYLIDLNASHAAVRAGYPKRSAKQRGYELLQRPRVAAALTKAATERSQRVRAKADDVLRHLEALALSEATDWLSWDVDDDGKIKNVRVKASAMLAPETKPSIKKVRVRADGSVDLETHSKDAPLALLAKHHGLVNDHVVLVKVQSTVEQILDAVEPRMSPEAYAELVTAIGAAMGQPGVAAAEAGEGSAGGTAVH